MSALVTRSSNPAIREVSRGLAAARDTQILQAVAMVDAMPNRGAADQLIAPLRGRLARLKPPRPLRFARLLFMPLDPLIVDAARWRPEQPAIPRTAIPVLAIAVENALGSVGRRIATMIEGRTTQDLAIVAMAGSLLWPQASRVLLDAPPAAGWDTTGLHAQVHKPLSRRIGALLSQAERLRVFMADAAQGLAPPEVGTLQAMLTEATGLDPSAWPMLVALLLAQAPECAPLLPRLATLMGQRDGALLRHAGEQAAEILLDQLAAPGGAEAHLGGRDLTEAGAEVRRMTLLLCAIDGENLSGDQRERLAGVRRRIKAGCQSLFTERLAVDLLDPLRARSGETASGTASELETAARGLRALETEAQRAGPDQTYGEMLADAAALVRAITAQGRLERVEGLRLVEIVAGSEAALASFGQEV